MNTIVLLALPESIVQHGAGKQDQWQRYMTILAIDYGIIQSISIPTVGIVLMMKFDLDSSQKCFRQDILGTLTIR